MHRGPACGLGVQHTWSPGAAPSHLHPGSGIGGDRCSARQFPGMVSGLSLGWVHESGECQDPPISTSTVPTWPVLAPLICSRLSLASPPRPPALPSSVS